MAGRVQNTIDIPTTQYIRKTYTIECVARNGPAYEENTQWIAFCIFNSFPQIDDIHITVKGSFHFTYPNPEHISVSFTHNDINSGDLHLSIDEFGMGYIQPIFMGCGLPAVGKKSKSKGKGKGKGKGKSKGSKKNSNRK